MKQTGTIQQTAGDVAQDAVIASKATKADLTALDTARIAADTALANTAASKADRATLTALDSRMVAVEKTLVRGVPTLSVDWIAELVAGVSSDRIKTLTLAEDTIVTFDLDWLNGSGPRHTDLKIVDATTKLKVAQFNEPVWFGGSGQRQIKLAAGSYRIYPSSRNYNSDRGVLQVVVSSDKHFGLV